MMFPLTLWQLFVVGSLSLTTLTVVILVSLCFYEWKKGNIW